MWYDTIVDETGMSEDQINAMVEANRAALEPRGSKRRREITIVDHDEVDQRAKAARTEFEESRKPPAAASASAVPHDPSQLLPVAIFSLSDGCVMYQA